MGKSDPNLKNDK